MLHSLLFVLTNMFKNPWTLLDPCLYNPFKSVSSILWFYMKEKLSNTCIKYQMKACSKPCSKSWIGPWCSVQIQSTACSTIKSSPAVLCSHSFCLLCLSSLLTNCHWIEKRKAVWHALEHHLPLHLQSLLVFAGFSLTHHDILNWRNAWPHAAHQFPR